LKRLNTLQPSSAEAKKMLARALLEDGQFEAAARIYIELSLLEPDQSRCVELLGQVNKRLQNWVAARDAWVRLTEISPDRPESRLELASACHQAGDSDAAQAEFAMDPGREPDHRGGADAARARPPRHDPEGSLTCWSRLTALDPAAVEPKLQIARIHLADNGRRRPRRGSGPSSSEIRPIARLWCRSAGLSGNAISDEAVRLFSRAETIFRQALDLAPTNVEALTGLGRLCSVGGRLDEAIGLWSQLAS